MRILTLPSPIGAQKCALYMAKHSNRKASSRDRRVAHPSRETKKTSLSATLRADVTGFCLSEHCSVVHQLGDGRRCGWNTPSSWTCLSRTAGRQSWWQAIPLRAQGGRDPFGHSHFFLAEEALQEPITLWLPQSWPAVPDGWLACFSRGALTHPRFLGQC